MKQKVVVGMSGGVDSSVAALLLLEQGYDVIGVTMQIWQPEDECTLEAEGGCCGLSAVEDARRVAQILGIPYYVMNFRDVFREKVMDYFAQEYLHSRTPNPCIACNRYVKWEALLHRSLQIGADYIATGHYARIRNLPNGRYAVCNSVTVQKDQTYALYALTQEQLEHTLMPVGDYTKQQIRDLAEKAGLPVAAKRDSQEICFVPDNDYAGFLRDYTGISMPRGNFVTPDGEVLGRHKGLYHYTVGQRRGLGLPMGHRVFVKELRPDTNEVVVAENEDLFTTEVKMRDICYMGVKMPASLEAEAGSEGAGNTVTGENRTSASGDITGGTFLGKIRYGHRGTPCTARLTAPDEITCTFESPVRAATPGQALVLYRDDYVALGGTIV